MSPLGIINLNKELLLETKKLCPLSLHQQIEISRTDFISQMKRESLMTPHIKRLLYQDEIPRTDDILTLLGMFLLYYKMFTQQKLSSLFVLLLSGLS